MTVKVILPSSGTRQAMQLNDHVLTADFTIDSGLAVVIPRYVEIAAGVTLEIGADGDLEIS